MAITNNANFSYHYGGGDYEETASVEISVTPTVTMTKTAHPTTVTTGDTVTYFVTIILNAFSGEITNQIFSDILPPELEFVEGSLTIDAEKVEGDISSLPLNFTSGGEHLIVYQCVVL